MSRTDEARQVIARVHATLPADISFTERKRAIRAAYPFGEREYWPYKAWCKAQREYLAKYDPKAPQPPLLRDMMRETNPDISFPFSKDAPHG